MPNDDQECFDNFQGDIRKLLGDILHAVVGIPKKAISKAFLFGFIGLIIGYILYKICYMMGSVSSFLNLLQIFYFVFFGAVLGVLLGFFLGAKNGLKEVLIGNESLKDIINVIVAPAVDQAYRAKDKSSDLASNIKNLLKVWFKRANINTESQTESAEKKASLLLLPFRLTTIVERIISSKVSGLYTSIAGDIAKLDFRNSAREDLKNDIVKLCVEKLDLLLGLTIDQIFQKPLLVLYSLCFIMIVLPVIMIVIF